MKNVGILKSLMVERLLDILTEIRGQAYSAHSVKNAAVECFYNKHVNQLGKHDFFSFGKAVNKLKGGQLFFGQVNRDHLYLILGRHSRNCCIKEKPV